MNDWVKTIVTRDAVCTADERVEHRVEFWIHASEGIGSLMQRMRESGFLPPVSGGQATWVLYMGRKPICVFAQQDAKLRYVADADARIGEIPKAELFAARLKYFAQKDPELVHRKLSIGREIELV